MTIRVQQVFHLDEKKLAAILTPALLAPTADDKEIVDVKAGTAWVRFCDAHGLTTTVAN